MPEIAWPEARANGKRPIKTLGVYKRDMIVRAKPTQTAVTEAIAVTPQKVKRSVKWTALITPPPVTVAHVMAIIINTTKLGKFRYP